VDRTSEEHALNIDPFIQIRLLDLQRVDSELDRNAHRVRTLPEAVTASSLHEQVMALNDEIAGAEAALFDLRREQSRADADVELVRQRVEKDQQLLNSGSINDPKQLENLQHELGSLGRRQADLEDVEIEIMERVENAEHALAALVTRRDGLASDSAAANEARDVAAAALAAERAELASERALMSGEVPADLLKLYEKLRADHDGVGAAALHRGRCEGCHMELTAVDINRIREAPSNELLRCEECRRILIRTAESGL
jgi:predicted  nucleic acid-binding Zn-ribbon protein